MHRPWELDAVPLVIAPEEWERLVAALAQRAQVLNALLADVYGPQKLLRAGFLPPGLVFAHPGFLRPCHNVRVPQERYVHLYAADLARAPDDPQATSVHTPLHDVLRDRRGVCQDFAHVQIGCLRSLGLAARYVSGYLVTRPLPGQPRLVGADASHAWVSVYCPGYGWLDVDPTNNVLPSEWHMTIALGRDYSDVSPIKGVCLGGGQHTMRVEVDVVPVSA